MKQKCVHGAWPNVPNLSVQGVESYQDLYTFKLKFLLFFFFSLWEAWEYTEAILQLTFVAGGKWTSRDGRSNKGDRKMMLPHLVSWGPQLQSSVHSLTHQIFTQSPPLCQMTLQVSETAGQKRDNLKAYSIVASVFGGGWEMWGKSTE